MKNPLNKRIVRELKSDFSKYLIIFLFMIMLISLISGFLVTDNSFTATYNEGFEKFNIESGHITFDKEPANAILENIENKADLKFYELFYCEESMVGSSAKIRIYKNRDQVNLVDVMSGHAPSKKNEIALDRMFANNNDIELGDVISLAGKEFKVTGFVAFPDYSCLFESNADMMFDSVNFGVAIVDESYFDELSENRIKYNYAWKYNTKPADASQENEKSEELLDILEDVLKEYDQNIIQVQVDEIYDEAEALSTKLSDEFEKAGEEIKTKTQEATKKVVTKAFNSLEPMEMMELMGLSDEAAAKKALEIASKKSGVSLEEMVAAELGTTKEAINAMKDSMEEVENSMDELDSKTERKKINLDEYDDSSEYENDVDFSLDSVKDLVEKIEATGIYDTSKLSLYIDDIENLADIKIDDSKIISVDDYLPEYSNKAIHFTGDDMGKDKAMFIIFDYIVVCILAFIFAVTTANTIAKEAGVIGTLRASGYTKAELVRHYMVLPVLVTLIAAIVGNIIGYSIMEDLMVDMYYGSYSFPTYTSLLNSEAFIDTTVVPIILMFVINLFVLITKLQYSPLQFLRREISKRAKKKAVRLNTKIPIMHRFRLRILFQNIPAYLTLFIGIFFGGAIIVFGTMFGPLLDDYAELVSKSNICSYQYILKEKAETTVESAEKYWVTSLETMDEEFMTDEVTIYGVSGESEYIKAYIPKGKVLVSNGYADKYNLSNGSVIELYNKYKDKKYSFVVDSIYQYDAAIAVFMNSEDYCEEFKVALDEFSGYLSNEEITDIDRDKIYSVITEDDLLKVSRQLKVSMGEFFILFKWFGVIMFIMLMYLMTKQIIEKNTVSISLTKILGFTDGEIGGLYLLMTSLVVIVSLFVTIPLVDWALRIIFSKYMYKMMTGYIPYIVSKNCYITLVVTGIICYVFVAIFMMNKIKKIPKSDSLKIVE